MDSQRLKALHLIGKLGWTLDSSRSDTLICYIKQSVAGYKIKNELDDNIDTLSELLPSFHIEVPDADNLPIRLLVSKKEIQSYLPDEIATIESAIAFFEDSSALQIQSNMKLVNKITGGYKLMK